MKITADHVAKVASLARLSLTPQELQTYTGQLDAVLEYFAQIDEVDVSEVEPTSHAVPLSCPQRDDEPRPSLPREIVLDRAPQHDNEFFIVPKVIE